MRVFSVCLFVCSEIARRCARPSAVCLLDDLGKGKEQDRSARDPATYPDFRTCPATGHRRDPAHVQESLQRGNRGTAVTGTVAAAVKLVAKQVLMGGLEKSPYTHWRLREARLPIWPRPCPAVRSAFVQLALAYLLLQSLRNVYSAYLFAQRILAASRATHYSDGFTPPMPDQAGGGMGCTQSEAARACGACGAER